MSDSDLKYMSITLDRENQTFKAGDLVCGKVVAEFRQPTKVRGLRMEAVGEAVVGWTVSVASPNRREESHNVSCTGREEYFSWNFYLFGSETGRMIELPVAQLSYPFSIQLPIDLPSSLEHDNGCVRYSIKAIFERPWKSDCSVKNEISIDSNYDLNGKPQAALPIRDVIQKRFGCFCLCPLGKLHASIFIPSTGFVPGQPISVTVHCENESTVDVRKIKLSLRKKLQFHATSPQWTTKEVEALVDEVKCVDPYHADFEDDVTVQLKVPALLQPSGLEYCGLIDLSYSLRITIGFSGLHCDVEKNFPILIGTVPLYTSSNSHNSNTAMASLPSAPLLQGQSAAAGSVGMAPLSSTGDGTKSPPPAYEFCVQGAGTSNPPRFNPAHNYRPVNTGTNVPM